MSDNDITFEGIGINDQISYIKVDITKACRLGTNFAVSFYQLDYQGLVNSLMKKSEIPSQDVKPMPVSKIVMDLGGFIGFRDQINELFDNLPEDLKKVMSGMKKGE